MSMLRLIALLALSLGAAGCGLKGDLYLEEDTPESQEVTGSEAAPATEEAQDSDENEDRDDDAAAAP